MDCTTKGAQPMDSLYSGEVELSAAQIDNANYFIPLYARKTGYGACAIISTEANTVRVTSSVSITGLTAEILRVYLNYN